MRSLSSVFTLHLARSFTSWIPGRCPRTFVTGPSGFQKPSAVAFLVLFRFECSKHRKASPFRFQSSRLWLRESSCLSFGDFLAGEPTSSTASRNPSPQALARGGCGSLVPESCPHRALYLSGSPQTKQSFPPGGVAPELGKARMVRGKGFGWGQIVMPLKFRQVVSLLFHKVRTLYWLPVQEPSIKLPCKGNHTRSF